MTKEVYPAVIVVEGVTDKILLSSFLDAEIVTTNGSDVPHETIEYLKALKKRFDIVVLTDPDSPGKRIRDVLDSAIPGLQHAFIPKDKAIKRHKVGVAECDKDTILEALHNVVPAASDALPGNLTMEDLFDLGLAGDTNSSKKRETIGKVFHIGYGNAKTLLKRLNSLAVTREQIEEVLHESK